MIFGRLQNWAPMSRPHPAKGGVEGSLALVETADRLLFVMSEVREESGTSC